MTTSTLTVHVSRTPRDTLIAVAIFALAAFWLVLFAGGIPGYEPDGANALHIAQNVAAGEGVVGKYASLGDTELRPRPTITKPPLYASSAGLLIWLGLPPDWAAWLISGGAWAAAAALLFLIARQVLPLPYALFVPLFPALQVTSLRWGISIHEQALFVALTLATLWRLTTLAGTTGSVSWGQWTLLGALAALAMLASYQGVPLILVAVAYVLISARRDGGIKPLAAFGFGMAVVAAWPFLRFVRVWMSGIRPGFDVSTDTAYYKMLAGIVSAFQNDLLGRQFVWLYDGSTSDVILVALFYSLLLTLIMYAAWSRRALRPLAAFLALYLAMLAAQLGGAGKDVYEPRYNLPLYGLFFLFVVYGIHKLADHWKWPSAGVAIGALALILLVYGQSARYPDLRKSHGALCPAPLTLSWIKHNIPAGSVIAAPQCGYQLVAESNAYYWLAIPPATDVGTSARWDERNFLPACKFRVGVWIALIGDGLKDPFREKPGYGPFVEALFNGKPGAYTKLVNRTTDGLVYHLDCAAAGQSVRHPR